MPGSVIFAASAQPPDGFAGGAIVCDYWGREFKVKKVISPELVLGKLQDKSGKTKAKPQKIYGNWKTGKPRAG